MSEGPADSAENPVLQTAAMRVTAGSLLKAAREREGLHIAALAVSMKVPVKKLEALEADRLDLLPDAVFVRALAASVCRTLKTDATPVLALLPASAPPRLNSDDRGINTPFDAPGQANNSSLRSLLFTPPALMVIALILAAVSVYFYPVTSSDSTVSDKLQAVTHTLTPEPIPELAEPVQTSSQPVLTSPLSNTSGPGVASASSSPMMLSSIPQAPGNVSSAPIFAAPVVPIAEMLNPTTSASNTNQGNVLQFKAKGAAWVQVTDAKGLQLLSKTLQSGEIVGVAGTLPFTVVVGRVDLTSVELRGKPYDLSTIAQNNVARFEVKQ